MLKYALRDNLLPLATAAVLVGVISSASWWAEFDISYNIYSPLLLLGPSSLILSFVALTLWALWRDRPARPTGYVIGKFNTDWRGWERALRGGPIFLFFPVFLSAFTSYKSALGHIMPFYFDPYARYLDRVLLGEDGWEFYSWMTGYPLVTLAMSYVYYSWFFAMFIVLSFAAFGIADNRLRSQFLTSFLLCWFLIGVVAATALSSVGPCYYLHFYGDSSFEYINQYFASVAKHYPLNIMEVQRAFLEKYTQDKPGLGQGISAMPSMHVSIATLMALLMARYGRMAAVVGWSYCAAISIASVHLGWHYAIDGYLAILMTVLIWKGVGVVTGYLPPDGVPGQNSTCSDAEMLTLPVTRRPT